MTNSKDKHKGEYFIDGKWISSTEYFSKLIEKERQSEMKKAEEELKSKVQRNNSIELY